MRTLYLTDMDGTFLNNSGVVSETSKSIINELSDKGLLFSVATARSILSARPLLDGVKITAPAVLQGGVVIYDFQNCKTVRYFTLTENNFNRIIRIFKNNGKSPFAFFFNKENEKYEILFTDLNRKEHRNFYESRHKMLGSLIHKTDNYYVPKDFEPIFISLCDKYEDLVIIKEEIDKLCGVNCSFYKDTYTPLWFLEVFNSEVSKANGLLIAKEYAKADRVVAFGDNLNDLSLFSVADESYAVENAVEELKAKADKIIGANEKDGVAQYLLSSFST